MIIPLYRLVGALLVVALYSRAVEAQSAVTFLDISPPLAVAPTVEDYGTRASVDFRDLTVSEHYQIRLQTIESPSFTAMRGGRILSYAYDTATHIATYSVEFTDRSDTTIGVNQLFIEVYFSGSILPTFWTGGYVSTNNLGIGLIDPYEGHPAFGFVLYGQPGDTPFIELFISEQMLAQIDTLYGSSVSLESMEFYSNDTKQQNTSIEAVAGGGGLAKCTMTIDAASSSAVAPTSQISQSVTIEESRVTPTLSANKRKVARGSTVKLSSLIEGCDPGTLVHLYRSLRADENHATLKHGPADAECRVTFSDKPRAKAYYYVVYDGTESSHVSVNIKKK